MAIPVSLEDAKCQLRHYDEDLTPERQKEVQGFIADAAAWVERYTGHKLVAEEVTEQFRGFGAVQMRAWPIAATAVPGVAYRDAASTPIAIVGARLDVTGRPARVLPPSGAFYPFRDAQQLFTVTVRAGYEDDEPVPRDMRRAMLVLISGYDADREGGDLFAKAEAAARRLCRDYRLRRV